MYQCYQDCQHLILAILIPPGAKTFGLTRFTVTPKDFAPAQARLVVSALKPALRPVRLSQNWFQIPHHQDKWCANEHHRLINDLAARCGDSKIENVHNRIGMNRRERAKLPSHQKHLGLTKKAEPPPTRDVSRDSGTDRANGGWRDPTSTIAWATSGTLIGANVTSAWFQSGDLGSHLQPGTVPGGTYWDWAVRALLPTH
jgi:hypothetical protein